MILLLALACTTPTPGGAVSELPALPPAAAVERCVAEPVAELRTGCAVDVAARAGVLGDVALVERACALTAEGVWRDECHFRAGEELAATGHLEAALAQCAQSGSFQRFCLAHGLWRVPPDAEPEGDGKSAEAWVALVASTLPEGLHLYATETLRARWWFNQYVGTGAADPALARAAPANEGPQARGAWAIEWARLRGPGAPLDLAAAHAAWEGRDPPLTGAPLGPQQRGGNKLFLERAPHEGGIPSIPTWGDGYRIVGLTPEEDLDIALLWAEGFLGRRAPTFVLPWLDDPRPRVRYSAFRILRAAPPPDINTLLRRYQDDPDPLVRDWAKPSAPPPVRGPAPSGPPVAPPTLPPSAAPQGAPR